MWNLQCSSANGLSLIKPRNERCALRTSLDDYSTVGRWRGPFPSISLTELHAPDGVDDVTNISNDAAMDREYATPSSRLRRAAAAARRSVRRWRRPEMRSVSLRYTQLPAA